MLLYSLALTLGFLLASPYWLLRMLTTGRYRAGLLGRLGRIPRELRAGIAGKQVVWLHAVSVGEVLAATRLVRDLEHALNQPNTKPAAEWVVVVSTTTATGQALAHQRFADPTPTNSTPPPSRVFWYPLDFAFVVRTCLRTLRPRLLILMESELWPRMLHECRRVGIPVAVVNARVSDRSYARGLKFRALWSRLLRHVTLFLAQSRQDADRLLAMGAARGSVQPTGNLKYDIRAPRHSPLAERIRQIADGRTILVAGSTLGPAGARTDDPPEDAALIAVQQSLPPDRRPLLVLAPRKPDSFAPIYALASKYPTLLATELLATPPDSPTLKPAQTSPPQIIVLDTIGDLAAVYGIADLAFVGGSLVPRGGHNPLEPAQFGVPILMGPSFENFRDIVDKLRDADAIRIVPDPEALTRTIHHLLAHPEEARALGTRARQVCEQQQGATARTVSALLTLLRPEARP